MRREQQPRIERHFLQAFDEHGPLIAETLHDMAIMHDLVVDVDRRAVELDRAVERVDRHIDAGTKTARAGQQDFHAISSLISIPVSFHHSPEGGHCPPSIFQLTIISIPEESQTLPAVSLRSTAGESLRPFTGSRERDTLNSSVGRW